MLFPLTIFPFFVQYSSHSFFQIFYVWHALLGDEKIIGFIHYSTGRHNPYCTITYQQQTRLPIYAINIILCCSLGHAVKRVGQPMKPVLGMLSWQLCDLAEIMKVIITGNNYFVIISISLSL